MTTQIKGNATSTFGGNIDVTGNVVTDAPLFYAGKTDSAQSVSPNTATKITFNNAIYNLSSNYDTSTSRFTPTVEGYYQIIAQTYLQGPDTDKYNQMILRKNGSTILYGDQNLSNSAYDLQGRFNAIIYANGSTDYFEIYVYHNNSTARNIWNNSGGTFFQGYLARAV